MKCYRFLLGTVFAILVLVIVNGDNTLTERQGKFIGNINFNRQNLERVIARWNRDNAKDMSKVFRSHGGKGGEFEGAVRQSESEEGDGEPPVADVYSFMDRFSSAFKKCIFSHKREILESGFQGKDIIFKCFKVVLVKRLRNVIEESDSISLLNGYVKLEKLDKPKKGYISPKVSRRGLAKQTPEDRSFHGYQDIVRDLLVEKGRSKRYSSNIFDNDTASGVQTFSRYGKDLITQIEDNLDHEEEEERSLKDSLLDSDFLSVLDEMSRKFGVRLSLFPGVAAKMRRSQSTGVTFDLELNDLTGFGDDDDDDDDDDDKKKLEKKNGKDDSSEEEEEEEEEDAGEGEEEADEEEEEEEGYRKGKGKDKGNKEKKKMMKKKAEMLKKIIPYLLIPMMIQAVMLPLAFKFLLFFAIKALLAGKIALLLVAINLIKNANFKSDEEEYIDRVGQDHYGYGKGEEYGAWINRRALNTEGEEEEAVENHPYRGYAPATERK